MRLGSFFVDQIPGSALNSVPTHLTDIATSMRVDLYKLYPTAHFEQNSAPQSRYDFRDSNSSSAR
jgi:hypothetical protein